MVAGVRPGVAEGVELDAGVVLGTPLVFFATKILRADPRLLVADGSGKADAAQLPVDQETNFSQRLGVPTQEHGWKHTQG